MTDEENPNPKTEADDTNGKVFSDNPEPVAGLKNCLYHRIYYPQDQCPKCNVKESK